MKTQQTLGREPLHILTRVACDEDRAHAPPLTAIVGGFSFANDKMILARKKKLSKRSKLFDNLQIICFTVSTACRGKTRRVM